MLRIVPITSLHLAACDLALTLPEFACHFRFSLSLVRYRRCILPPHTHTYTRTHTLRHALRHAHLLTHSLTHAHTHAHTKTRTKARTFTHSLTHAHTHACAHAHNHAHQTYEHFASDPGVGISRSEFRIMLIALGMHIPHTERKILVCSSHLLGMHVLQENHSFAYACARARASVLFRIH